jgi:MAF protein
MTRNATTPQATRAIVLASSSPYRRELMLRLGLPFTWAAPAVNEDPLAGENPLELVQRLALSKARSLADKFPDALIIGSDQVAVLAEGRILTKPGEHAAARSQLQSCSGRVVSFKTGLCLLDAGSAQMQADVVECEVFFRQLLDAEIERYLLAERPYDCAGAFKSEGLGLALLSGMRLPDPSALIGLPLIALAAMLRRAGVPVP